MVTVEPSTSTLRAPDSCGTPSFSLSSAAMIDSRASVDSEPQTTRSYSSVPSAAATSLVLARAIEKIGQDAPVDLVLTGMASTDAVMSVVPAMLAERLGLPQVTYASELTVDAAGRTVQARRDGDAETLVVTATLPALVSVTDQINEPRYPSFKGIMAAKKKPVQTWTLADLGVEPAQVGLAASWTTVEQVTARPPREQGQVVKDDGEGGLKLAEFLTARKFV